MKDSRNVKSSYQLLIIDIIVFAILGAVEGLIGLRQIGLNKSESLLLGFTIPLFLFISIGLILYVLAEYKFNRLKLKNIFLFLSLAIVICNIVAIASLPNKIILPSGVEMAISPLMRTYYLLSGCAFGLVPYLCFYLIPRKVLHRRYMYIILYILLGISLLLIFISLIVEWKNFGIIFNDFINAEKYALQSICGHKNAFARFILLGVFATVLLRIYQKKARWLLFNIVLIPFMVLTFSKITTVVAIATLLIYFIARLIMICKKSKDNLIITLLITGFSTLLLSLFIVGLARSESGVLFEIKNSFIKIGESASKTIGSRIEIWRCCFQILKPLQYIFGFGITAFGAILHNTYTLETNIYSAHNMVIELIGKGGIIMLAIYLFLYVYVVYIALKLRKKSPYLVFASIILLFMTIVIGMVESIFICCAEWGILISAVTLLPIMSEYYIQLDEDEVKVRKEIVKQSKTISKRHFTSKLLILNQKRIIYSARQIAKDKS